jgi:hypothetical protein
MNWSYWCDGIQIDAGAINISAFCTSNDPVVYNFDALPCFLQMQVSISNLECKACGTSGVVVDCCGTPVDESLTLTISGGVYAGTYSMTYAAGEWVNDTGAFSARLSCDLLPEWILSFEMDTYGNNTDCLPVSFDLGGGVTATVS